MGPDDLQCLRRHAEAAPKAALRLLYDLVDVVLRVVETTLIGIDDVDIVSIHPNQFGKIEVVQHLVQVVCFVQCLDDDVRRDGLLY